MYHGGTQNPDKTETCNPINQGFPHTEALLLSASPIKQIQMLLLNPLFLYENNKYLTIR
jgi:hypothetical protein